MIVDPRRATFGRRQRRQIGPIDDHRTRLAQQLALPRCEHAVEHHRAVRGGNAREIDGDTTHGLGRGAAGTPVAVHPDIGLHGTDLGLHAQAHLHIGTDRATKVHALRSGIAHPQVGGRRAHIDGRGAENTQHQRRLHHQQHAGKADRKHRWDEATPFICKRLAGQGDHGWRPSAGGSAACSSAGNGAPPRALYSAT